MIKKNEWDSNHFGINIAEVDIAELERDMKMISLFAEKENISVIQSCCDISDIKSINLLEKNGFYFADLKMTYFLDLENINIEKAEVVFAVAKDVFLLKKIAAKSFVDKSRYYHDFFEKEKADKLFEIWIEKAVNGTFDDFCIKTEKDGVVAGFITGKKIDDLSARIGIIGVDDSFQSRGAGTKLLESLFYFYKSEGVKSVYVSTQGKNIGANNFYIKNGFKIKNIEAWFYKKYN
ncbi:MAG: TDP-fucosamine acetyltransferase [Candidatus Moranbacteria bacterium GW2011_GWE1_35_17]|nr:MAG: TDP-fucosamine acetyltransferase [Candidatus Moranbacteria bacterium GW2011_GWE1_35_17]KKP89559.1 MAG: TDP-fucosamine acetyltransferase [Parcubacteria group bacterium GW2011_GWC1_36_108]HCU01672.1 hypothetical protein [Candidatus Nomurabacteria bacterium]